MRKIISLAFKPYTEYSQGDMDSTIDGSIATTAYAVCDDGTILVEGRNGWEETDEFGEVPQPEEHE